MKTQNPQFDVISVGDTTTDVFLRVEDADVFCKSRKEDCLLCFRYTDKVATEEVTEIDAVGNAANNAVGSARLGLKTAIWTILGDDTNGRQALDVFKSEKVVTDFIETDKVKGTNYSVVINYQSERTILVYHNDRNYVFPLLPSSKWVYLTSMGHGWEKIYVGLNAYLEQSKSKLAFNPGTHQIKSGLSVLKPFLEKTSLVILNVEEAQTILRKKIEPSILLEKMHALGPEFVVITDGKDGTYAYDGKEKWYVPIYPDPGPVVERTGSGDSFATAVVAAIINKCDLGEALQWGSANARMVVQFVGAQTGLQTKAKIRRTIKSFPDIRPKKI